MKQIKRFIAFIIGYVPKVEAKDLKPVLPFSTLKGGPLTPLELDQERLFYATRLHELTMGINRILIHLNEHNITSGFPAVADIEEGEISEIESEDSEEATETE